MVVKKRSFCDLFKDHRVILLTGFSLFSAGYYFVNYGKTTRLWHLAPALVGFNILFVHALKSLYYYVRGVKTAKIGVITMIIVILINSFFHVAIYRYKFRSPNLARVAVTTWVKENLSEEETIGIWNAGYIGYFSQRKVINLDGLINGKELYDYQKRPDGIWNYIVDKKIDYISGRYLHQREPWPKQSKLKNRLTEVAHWSKTPTSENGPYRERYVWKIEYVD
jgi:hypothetical protein